MSKKIDLYAKALAQPDVYIRSLPSYISAYYSRSRKRIPNITPLTHLVLNAVKNDPIAYNNLVADFAAALLNQKQNYEHELELCDKFIIKAHLKKMQSTHLFASYGVQNNIINYLIKTNLRPKVYHYFVPQADISVLCILFVKYWKHTFKDDEHTVWDKSANYYLNHNSLWDNSEFFDLRLRILHGCGSGEVMEQMEKCTIYTELFYHGMSDDNKLGIVI